MARKLAELLSFNRGIQPFYTACCFDQMSRGFVLCLLNASFRTAISQRHNSIFYSKINDHGIRRGNTGQILARWRHSVASKEALYMLHWEKCLATHRRIVMTIKSP
jgi:hypothetical protein